MAYLPPLNGGRINVSISGNTGGNASANAVSTGTVVFSGGNNITLSQSTGVGGATIGINAASQTNQNLNITLSGNTNGAASISTINATNLKFAGTGNVSLGFSNGSIQISGSGGGGGQVTAGGTTYTNGVSFVPQGALTLSGTNNQSLSMSVPAVTSISATGILSMSTTGSTVSMGVPAYSAGISAGVGNTSGTTGFATNQLVLAGGNNVTLSQGTGSNGNTLSIAGPTFSASNGIGFGTNGSIITASHNGITSQSAQVASASNGSFSFQTLNFSGGNGVTIGTSAGSIISASVATSYAASNHSHGNPTLNLTNLSGTTASASNGLTLSLSAAAQSNQVMTLQANTTNTIAGYSTSGTVNASSLNLRGTGNVSVGYSGGSIFISGSGGGGGPAIVGGASTYSSGSLSLTGAGALTVSPGANILSLSVPATSSIVGVNGITISTNGGTISISGAGTGGGAGGSISAGGTNYTNGVSFVPAGALSFSTAAGSTLTMSAPAVSQLTYTGAVSMSSNGSTVSIGAPIMSLGMTSTTAGGATAGTSGTVTNGLILAAGSNITLSQSTNANGATVSIHGPAGGGANTASYTATYSNGSYNTITSAGYSSTGTYDMRSFRLAAMGNLSAGYSNGSVVLSASAPSGSSLSATGAVSISTNGGTISIGAPYFSAGMSNIGNTTAGNTGMVNNRLVLAGAGNVTLKQSTDAGGATVSISATGGGGGGGAISAGGTNYTAGVSMVPAGALSFSTAAGSTLTMSAPAASSLVGVNGITLSSNGTNITISGAGGAGTISNWEPYPLQMVALSASQVGNGVANFMKLAPQAFVSASQLMQLVSMSLSSSSNSSYVGAISVAAGIYSANGSTLSLITQSSGSTVHRFTITGTSSTNSVSLVSALRGLTLPININASPGNYWLGLWSATASTNTAWFTASNIYMRNLSNAAFVFNGLIGQASNSTQGVQEAVGLYSSVAALPTNAPMSKITQYALSGLSSPYVAFKNMTW